MLEKALSQSELLDASQILDTHAIISITDVNGNILYANEKFCDISGYTQEELLDKSHNILKSGQHPDSFYQDIWQTISSGKIWHGEICNKNKNGDFYWVKSTIAPFLNSDGKPYKYISYRTDITDSKQNNDLLNLTIAATGDAVWNWNITTGEFTFTPAYEAMLGYEQGELDNHIDSWIGSVHPEDLPRVKSVLRHYLQHQISKYEVEVRLKCKNGSWKWIFCRGKLIYQDQAGKPLAMMGLHTDISHRRAMEEALVYEKELSNKANQEKSRFLSSMSHELRTPLNAIIGFTEMLEMDKDELSEDHQENIEFILKSGRHLLTLINDVLELSAIDAGKIDIQIEALSLPELLDDTLSLMTYQANKARIQIHVLSDKNLTISADYTRLKQVLINLIGNAIKYNSEQGEVKIDWYQTENNTVRISVADNGFGIPLDKQDQVFSAFNRLGQENSKIEGTGIGLVVTKQLVEMMHGAIGFDSIPQQGTTFWIEIPLAEQNHSDTSDDDLVIDQTEKATLIKETTSTLKQLLYIEDNITNQKLVESLCKKHAHLFNLHIVDTAELGWQYAMANEVDLILMDIQLPDMDGIELTKKLRETDLYTNKPIIAFTASAMKHDIDRAGDLFDSYISKPAHMPDLLKLLKTKLDLA